MSREKKSFSLMEDVKTHIKNLSEIGISEVSFRSHPPQKNKSFSHKTLTQIHEEIGDCKRCKLCEKRTRIVFGVGNPDARLFFVGEGPGHDEDLKGEPFVGKAGQLLTKMISAMGFTREEVYIANIVKCRPPDNRYPEPEEVETCLPFLIQQIQTVHPEVIVTLGNLASQTLLKTKKGITSLRGNFYDFEGFQLRPTYHPAFLLRNPNMKAPCWEDLKKVMAFLKKG